jgi:transcriptional regulator with PAS, ATPase and Fis domain
MVDAHRASASSTEALRAGADHMLLERVRFTVVEGPDKGSTFASSGPRTVVGTAPTTDVTLTDPTVSRFHCEIVIAGSRTLVRDLGSTNETIVSGVAVREARLDPGAIVALGRTRLRLEPADEPVKVRVSEKDRFGSMVGGSVASRRAFALLEHAAASDATVLLRGETGTGKEVAAESIHAAGKRREDPFVVVDCGAIPPTLLESELFGHERGAFTGADRSREGAFEAANGGTIFLDEIGELGADLQPKLLRALEKREIKRIGSNRVIALDVRVVAATNRDLRAEVNAKTFRADLYYRLAVLEIVLPPLRERLDDLPLLVESIVGSLGATARAEAAVTRTPAFLQAVRQHAWPGNVRELRNYVERCLALREEAPLASEPGGPQTGLDVDTSQPLAAARSRHIDAFERAYLEAIIARHAGNVTAAARAAGVDRTHFHRMLRKHGIRTVR